MVNEAENMSALYAFCIACQKMLVTCQSIYSTIIINEFEV